MSFTVVWKPAAERELAELWLASSTRQEIRAAADSIDLQLARDPSNFGEEREGNQRIAIVVPLVVEFEVREKDRMVSVQAVRVC
jgi:hypothetical protein